MRISDWSSDVCSSDLSPTRDEAGFALAKWDYKHRAFVTALFHEKPHDNTAWEIFYPAGPFALLPLLDDAQGRHRGALVWTVAEKDATRSEEHTSELQSLMRISYAVFCLKKKTSKNHTK